MRKNIGTIFLLFEVVMLVVLSGCHVCPTQLTDNQAAKIAQPYFQKAHMMNVVIEKVEYRRVSQEAHLNFITVSDGEAKYELVLDERNRPLADNVSSLVIISNTKLSLLSEKIKPSELGLKGLSNLDSVFSYQDRRYNTQVFASVADVPAARDSKDGIYALLGMLKNSGINKFVIEVGSPDFLLPKMEFGHGTHGIQLSANFFDTNLSLKDFEQQYYGFIGRVHWDKQKFENKILELSEIGYKNAYFFVSGYVNGSTIEIVLYCESAASLDDGQASTLLKEMDDSCFKIEGKETKYTLQHVFK